MEFPLFRLKILINSYNTLLISYINKKIEILNREWVCQMANGEKMFLFYWVVCRVQSVWCINSNKYDLNLNNSEQWHPKEHQTCLLCDYIIPLSRSTFRTVSWPSVHITSLYGCVTISSCRSINSQSIVNSSISYIKSNLVLA